MTTDEQREVREPRSGDTSLDARRPESASGRTTSRQRADQTTPSQVSQVLQEIGRWTRRLTTSNSSAAGRVATRRVSQRQPPPSRERLAGLLAALGDPAHPLHAQAVDEFISIGDAAVPTLIEALQPNQSWLTSYRAAEALGHIGDGRAAGALINALNHSNSNVRWSAVRALSQVGDARAIFPLRRVAKDDRGKTSWGEPVSGAAQSALDQMQRQSPLGQGLELIKTAVTCVLMILALVLAFGMVSSLRQELDRVGEEVIDASVLLAPRATAQPGAENAPATEPTVVAQPTPEVLPTVAAQATIEITGTVLQQAANVRPVPSSVQNDPIGRINPGDEIVFLAVTSDRQWYRIRLGGRHADKSAINSSDGTGWVNQSLVSEPSGAVPLEEVNP